MRNTKQTRAVAAWPRIDVEINEDGTGQVRIAGLVTAELAGEDQRTAQDQAISHLAQTAAKLGRPVQATTHTPQGPWVIVVDPDGTLRAEDDAPGRTKKRAKKARTTPASTPVSHKREGAGTPGRGVPPTGHGRDPHPPYVEPDGLAVVIDESWAVDDAAGESAIDALIRPSRSVPDAEAEQHAAELRRVAAEAEERARQAAQDVAREIEQARERCSTVLQELRTATDQASATLAGSLGKVEQETVRDELADTIAEADVVLTWALPDDVDALNALGRTANDKVDAVHAAAAAVLAARGLWEAEETARLAAEAAAAERAARQAAERRAQDVAQLAAAREEHATAIEDLRGVLAAADSVLADKGAFEGDELHEALVAAADGARQLLTRPAPAAARSLADATVEAGDVAGDLRSTTDLVQQAAQRAQAAVAAEQAERASHAAAVRQAAEAAALAASRHESEQRSVAPAADGAAVEATDAVEEGPALGPAGDAVVVAARRRLPRARVLVAAGLAIVVCAGGAITWRTVAASAVTAAHAQWVDERLALTEEISAAQDLLAAATGEVGDESVLQELQDAITAALQARTDPAEGDGASGADAGRWQSAQRDVVGAAAVLRSAVDAVEHERTAWTLAQAADAWDEARTALAGAVDEASSVVAATAGQVADDAVRQTLAAAIDAAVHARDVEVDPDDVDALAAAATAARGAGEALAGPVGATLDAQAAWVAEQERVAAAQAAAAAAAAKPATSKPSTAVSQPAAAPAASTQTQTGGQTVSIKPGTVSSSSLNPGQVAVSATTSGVSGPVVVTIGGVSQTIGTGSGTFSGVVTGLAPGSYTWSVSADGLVVTGKGQAVVP